MSREGQKMRSEALRSQILDTALEIGLTEGFDSLSVRKIITKMQYSTSIIYHYFKNKQEIIDAIVESESKKLGEKIAGLLDPDKSIVENIKQVFFMITMLAVHEPEKYNLVVFHKYSNRNADFPVWISYISDGLKHGISEGQIQPIDTEKAAFSIWSSFIGFHFMLTLREQISDLEAEELFKVQFNIIMKGILTNE